MDLLNIAVFKLDSTFNNDTFDGTLTMNSGDVDVQVDDGDWGLYGRLEMNHVFPFGVPVLSGNTINHWGDIVVTGNGTSRISAPLIMNSGATITVGPSATLQSTASLHANAGTITLRDNSTAVFDGTAQIDDAVVFDNQSGTISSSFRTTMIVNNTVDIGSGGIIFDWDGTAENSRTIVNENGTLTLDVNRLDTDGTDTFDGRLEMNSGDVVVQVADGDWGLAGDLFISNTASDVPVLSGDDINLFGDIEVGGSGDSKMALR